MKRLIYYTAYIYLMVFIMPFPYATATILAMEQIPGDLDKFGEFNILINLNKRMETNAGFLNNPAFDMRCFALDLSHNQTIKFNQGMDIDNFTDKYSVKLEKSICQRFLLANLTHASKLGDIIGQSTKMQQLLNVNVEVPEYKNVTDEISWENPLKDDEDVSKIISRIAPLFILAFIGLVAVARRIEKSK